MQIFSVFKSGLLIFTAGAAFSLAAVGTAAAQQCPEWQLGGVPISTDAEAAWAPQQFPMYAGGAMNLSECQSVPGTGYTTPAPSFSLSYDDRGLGRDLEFRIQSDCDTTLLINDATANWSFNDDSIGLNAALRLTAPRSGRYDIWIGTWSPQACQATLIIESFPPTSQQADACPEWSLGGAEWRLTAGQSESRPVVAGGPLNMHSSSCDNPASGFLTAAPDFSLYFDNQGQPTTLDLSVQGDCDQTLLVNTANASWEYNDDGTNLNPHMVLSNAPSGRYDIWVGTWSQQTCQSTLTINAMGSQPAQPGTPSK